MSSPTVSAPRTTTTARTTSTDQPATTTTAAPATTAKPAQKQADPYENTFSTLDNVGNGHKSVTDVVGGLQTKHVGGKVEGINSHLGRSAGIVGTLAAGAQLPGNVYTAQKDVRDAVKNPTKDNVIKAGGSVANAVSTASDVAKGTLESAAAVQTHRAATKAATAAFKTAVPGASKSVVKAAAHSAAKTAALGSTAHAVEQATVSAAKTAAKAGTTVRAATGAATRAAGNAALRAGGKAAAHAATEAVAHTAASTLGKAAGRFAPGLNVAIAVADSAVAAATLADKSASTTKKVTSVITAAGSIAAATNIPIVSQVGAAVSTVSSLVGGLFGG